MLSIFNNICHLFLSLTVCDNCHELKGPIVIGIICGDLLITGGIILIVYLHGQRKSGPAPQKRKATTNPNKYIVRL